jgi:hypothetical protein
MFARRDDFRSLFVGPGLRPGQVAAVLLCGAGDLVACRLAIKLVTLLGAQFFDVASIEPNRTGSEDSGDNTGHGRLTAIN